MDASQTTNVITIVSAFLSPFIGAAVAVWTYRAQVKERLAVQIVWGHRPGQSGQPEECPFLYVQNISDRPVSVTEIYYMNGAIRRKRQIGTALNYVDPFFDISFPYEIEAGKSLRFELNDFAAKRVTDAATKFQQAAHRLGRSAICLEVRTMANLKVRINAGDATPWQDRALWLK